MILDEERRRENVGVWYCEAVFGTHMPIISPNEIGQAVAALREGKLVAFPTETVYGLGADAANESAVRQIFAAKGRPADHPLIVHLPDVAALKDWARDIPPTALLLARRFWPGPLTMILPKATHVPAIVTGGQQSIGLRIPDHPVALALLSAFNGGIAAPSANRFGRISPTRAEHVEAELGTSVAWIIDGGPCRVGVESSIIDLTGDQPVLLRPGHISASAIAEVVGVPVAPSQRSTTRAPGMLASHYAPMTRTKIIDSHQLQPTIMKLVDEGQRVAVLARQPAAVDHPSVWWQAAPNNPEGYAHYLYAYLRRLDALQYDRILVEAVPEDEAWLAVRDRLRRAAFTEAAG